MIEITYHKKYYGLTAVGHAHSGDPGRDLVCASVSALVLTLAANVQSLADAGTVRDCDIQVGHGQAEISCKPVRRFGSVVSVIYDTVCAGFELLQGLYPEFIQYREMG
jgi:uncharacterized protein YsxB (DUF464 family)